MRGAQQCCICRVQLCSLLSLVLLGLLNTRLVTVHRLSSDLGESGMPVLFQVPLDIQVWIPCPEGAVGVDGFVPGGAALPAPALRLIETLCLCLWGLAIS